MQELLAHYSKRFRSGLGFQNQSTAKSFLSGKDIVAPVDQGYINSLLDRLCELLERLNCTVHEEIRHKDIQKIINESIRSPARLITDQGILAKLNNQGRRPEEVLFSWLRGYAVVEYFFPAIGKIFNIDHGKIFRIGDDDFRNIDTFRRTPSADLKIHLGHKTIHIEVQSGFQGINDIKEHKLREARRLWSEKEHATVCIHFDVFNGQVAFVRLDTISENDIHMVTRQQMEGQSVFQ